VFFDQDVLVGALEKAFSPRPMDAHHIADVQPRVCGQFPVLLQLLHQLQAGFGRKQLRDRPFEAVDHVRVNECDGGGGLIVREALADQPRRDLPNILVRAFQQEVLE